MLKQKFMIERTLHMSMEDGIFKGKAILLLVLGSPEN
jgi:hypothetical protein